MKTYQVFFSSRGRSDLMELQRGTSRILLLWIMEYLDHCMDPRVLGRSLNHMTALRKYNVGRYCILTQIHKDSITILAVTKGQSI